MSLRSIAWMVSAFTAAATALPAAAAQWHAVPGSENLEVDLQSAQLDGSRVTVWLRWSGGTLPVSLPMAAGAKGQRAWRTNVWTEFDCSTRRLRLLSASGWNRAGQALFMSSVPGATEKISSADFGWAYDAVCEAARSARS